MIEMFQTTSPKIVGVRLSGKLHHEDYKSFVPALDTVVAAEGRGRLFVLMEAFHGADLHAVWDDIKFGLKHFSDFDRIATVGDRRWEKWMVQMSKPFVKAKAKYFDMADIDAARAWIGEG
jgi:hypothetical protein